MEQELKAMDSAGKKSQKKQEIENEEVYYEYRLDIPKDRKSNRWDIKRAKRIPIKRTPKSPPEKAPAEKESKQAKRLAHTLDLKKALDAEHDKKYYVFCLKYNVEKIERKITYLDGLISELSGLSKREQYQKVLSINKEAQEKANRIYAKRNHRVRDQLRKVARHLVDYCLDKRIATVVLGYKKGWKNSNLARKFNQYWHLTPVVLLIQRIKYNASLVGIKVYTIPEPYTSIRSAYNGERLGKVENPLGIRGPTMYPAEGEPYNARGLFKVPLPDDQTLYVHSDANGAFNIMRKFDQSTQKWYEANRKANAEGKRRRYPDANPTDFFAYFRENNGAHKNKILLAPETVDLSDPNPKMKNDSVNPIASA
ncbi:MAG: IS200/IS605 family element transposase accessory protein TnpB [Candidatus Lokiarchaeota archaeon]|nr:IS200/IS605 family element transposase accessory protein TnpB [Candidatus Lokiarchaeota archaeon]